MPPGRPPPFEGLESVKGPLLCGLLGIAWFYCDCRLCFWTVLIPPAFYDDGAPLNDELRACALGPLGRG